MPTRIPSIADLPTSVFVVAGLLVLLLLLLSFQRASRRRMMVAQMVRWAHDHGYTITRGWTLAGARYTLQGRTPAGMDVWHRLHLRQRTRYEHVFLCRTEADIAVPVPGQLLAVRGLRWSRVFRPRVVRDATLRAHVFNRNDDREYAVFVDSVSMTQRSGLPAAIAHLNDMEGSELRLAHGHATAFWELPCESESADQVSHQRLEACHALLRAITN